MEPSTSSCNGTSFRSNLSTELVQVTEEIEQLTAQIKSLQKRRSELVEKKNRLERRLDDSASEDHSKWELETFTWSHEARRMLTDIFKLEDFRPMQRSVINVAMSKEDCLVIMSTGSGKSLCYQLPAVLSKGITLVVSPLISLIEDQLIQLKKIGIEAATLNQSTAKQDVTRIQNSLTDQRSNLRLLYVTPEKLAKSKRIMNKLEKSCEMKLLKLIAIDEVHCCSQWGHDFRPDYQFLNILKRQFKGVPILGLTATATANVLDDVKSILGIQGAITLRAGFNRSNLFYEVREKPQSSDAILNDLVELINNRFKEQSGIIYCFSRKECEDLTKDLRTRGVKAAFYHAYMEADDRSKVHENWLNGKYHVIIATVAFGMGIDKPDVRYVIHHSIAKSMENYYQESGRAGRDGKIAHCILYYKLGDVFRQSTMVCTEKTGTSNLYSMLSYAMRVNDCRRVCIAEHFDETWDASWCNKMCDVCYNSTNYDFEETDISDYFSEIKKIIVQQRTEADQGRITGGKLVDIVSKRFKSGYLQEDFHFTPYSIISYMVLGARGKNATDQEKCTMRIQRPKNGHVRAEGPPKKKAKKIAENIDKNDDVILL